MEVVEIMNPLPKDEGEADEASVIAFASGSNDYAMEDGISVGDSTVEYATYEQAVSLLQEAMVDRGTTVSFSMKTDESYKYKSTELYYAAFEENGNPWHGDYLRCAWNSMFCRTGYQNNSGSISLRTPIPSATR